MNTQEAQLLQSFLDSLVQVRGVNKDRDAEAQIARAVSQQPDAAYLLVQRALLQDQALQAAQARITDLESKLAAPAPAQATNSFLSGGGWGRQAAAPASSLGTSAGADVSVTGRPLASNPVSGLAASRATPAQAAASATRGMGGGFLPAMAATAAGVVGGAFLFQGIQHLLNNNNAASNTAAAAPAGDNSLAEGSYAPDTYAAAGDQHSYNDFSAEDIDMGGDDSV